MIYSLGERRVEFRGDYYVAPSASVIGSVVLGKNASVWFNCVLRGDNDVITIGDNTNVQDASVCPSTAAWPSFLPRVLVLRLLAQLLIPGYTR